MSERKKILSILRPSRRSKGIGRPESVYSLDGYEGASREERVLLFRGMRFPEQYTRFAQAALRDVIRRNDCFDPNHYKVVVSGRRD